MSKIHEDIDNNKIIIYASVVYVYRKKHLLYINHILLDIIEVRNTNEPSFRKLNNFL